MKLPCWRVLTARQPTLAVTTQPVAVPWKQHRHWSPSPLHAVHHNQQQPNTPPSCTTKQARWGFKLRSLQHDAWLCHPRGPDGNAKPSACCAISGSSTQPGMLQSLRRPTIWTESAHHVLHHVLLPGWQSMKHWVGVIP